MSATGYHRNRGARGNHRSRVQKCRHCPRLLFWVTMHTGKRNPLALEQLDGDPFPDVLVIQRRRGDPEKGEAWILGVSVDPSLAEEAAYLALEVHHSHFADERCPGNAGRVARDAARRGNAS